MRSLLTSFLLILAFSGSTVHISRPFGSGLSRFRTRIRQLLANPLLSASRILTHVLTNTFSATHPAAAGSLYFLKLNRSGPFGNGNVWGFIPSVIRVQTSKAIPRVRYETVHDVIWWPLAQIQNAPPLPRGHLRR